MIAVQELVFQPRESLPVCLCKDVDQGVVTLIAWKDTLGTCLLVKPHGLVCVSHCPTTIHEAAIRDSTGRHPFCLHLPKHLCAQSV